MVDIFDAVGDVFIYTLSNDRIFYKVLQMSSPHSKTGNGGGFVVVFGRGRGYVLLYVTIQNVCAFEVQQAIFRYLCRFICQQRASRMNGER